jgi:hypothetical protein
MGILGVHDHWLGDRLRASVVILVICILISNLNFRNEVFRLYDKLRYLIWNDYSYVAYPGLEEVSRKVLDICVMYVEYIAVMGSCLLLFLLVLCESFHSVLLSRFLKEQAGFLLFLSDLSQIEGTIPLRILALRALSC